MKAILEQWILLLVVISGIQGCVTIHAPLLSDDQYPKEWGDILQLGPECIGIEGTYSNAGWVTGPNEKLQQIFLMTVLGLPSDANNVSISTSSRRFDQHGDAFIALQVSADGLSRAWESCYCIKQTLVCTEIAKDAWIFPRVAFGASQRNAYFARTRDRALIVKLQNYHLDVFLVVPVFGMEEPWARFAPSD